MPNKISNTSKKLEDYKIGDVVKLTEKGHNVLHHEVDWVKSAIGRDIIEYGIVIDIKDYVSVQWYNKDDTKIVKTGVIESWVKDYASYNIEDILSNLDKLTNKINK